MSLPEELQLHYKDVLDRSLLFYGASGSGKSFLIKHCMYILRRHIPQVIVINPTDPTNHTYSSGCVKKPLIHYTLTEDLLINIWKRQEAFSAIYAKANDFYTLEKLFNRLDLPSVRPLISRVHSCKAQHIAAVEEKYSDSKSIKKRKITEIEEQFKEFITLIYKRYIEKHRSDLMSRQISPDEVFCLKYLKFNPRMLLILDDCTADFKRIKSPTAKAILGKMFFQNRWAYMTILIAVHDDKMIESELRKNAYISVFTTPASAHAYFTRSSNAFATDTRRKIAAWQEAGLWSDRIQKLVYKRQEDTFYRFTAEDFGEFQFGAPILKEFCDKIEARGVNIDPNNQFISLFS